MFSPAVESSAPAQTDRRRTPRRPQAAQAWLASPTGGQRSEVLCVDLSRHGVGLNLSRPIAEGTFHILELNLGPQRIVSEIRIVSCQQADDNSFRASAVFC